MAGIFDSKYFNTEVFAKYMETVPRVKQNAFIKSGVFRGRTDLRNKLADQVGGNYIYEPMTGLIGGTPDNYDGSTDITTDSISTFLQGMMVVGRAHSWREKDFTYDITHKDFMAEIAKQVANYWDDVDQGTVLSVLKGIFGVNDDEFSEKHTNDISGSSSPFIDATTLNVTKQKAVGANRKIFAMVIAHSSVVTNLENLQLIDHWDWINKGTPNGIAPDKSLATWDGLPLLIDDDCPVETEGVSAGVYNVKINTKATAGDKFIINGTVLVAGTDFSLETDTPTGNATALAEKLNSVESAGVYQWTSNGANVIATEKEGNYGKGRPNVSTNGAMAVTVTTTTEPNVITKYTTYVLGASSIDFCDCGAKNPYTTWRQELEKGGIDYLITRQRKLFAPRGFSFVQQSPIIMSPTNEQLENSSMWQVVKNAEGTEYYNTKAIPFARIISQG